MRKQKETSKTSNMKMQLGSLSGNEIPLHRHEAVMSCVNNKSKWKKNYEQADYKKTNTKITGWSNSMKISTNFIDTCPSFFFNIMNTRKNQLQTNKCIPNISSTFMEVFHVGRMERIQPVAATGLSKETVIITTKKYQKQRGFHNTQRKNHGWAFGGHWGPASQHLKPIYRKTIKGTGNHKEPITSKSGMSPLRKTAHIPTSKYKWLKIKQTTEVNNRH